MCVGENCAPQAVHYINAQLASLYENALSCIQDHDVSHKQPEQSKYSHALAEYSYIDPHTKGHSTMFRATFGKPELEFICNHDVILRLKIHKGYYRLDYTKASSMTYSDKDRLQSVEEIELAFRVAFDMHDLQGKQLKFGTGQNLLRLIILDLPKAELISVNPAVIIGRDAFVFYLSQYLGFLHQAGNHVFFSLPDFEDPRYRLTVDFSLMDTTIPEVQDVHGISVEKINTYLSSVWLKAAMLLGGPEGTIADWKQTCLAEYRSTWSQRTEDIHYRVRLGAPRIKPICSREVVMCFSVDEVFVYDSEDFEKEAIRTYSGWEIAILVDVIDEKDVHGHVSRCTLDLTSARPYHQECKYTDVVEGDELALSFWTQLLEFFSSSYLDILESVEFHVIYHFDARWQTWQPPIAEEESGSEEELEVEGGGSEHEWAVAQRSSSRFTEWTETVTHHEISGFDQVLAISQSSINAHYVALREAGLVAKSAEHASILAKWSYEDYFSATFKPMTLRLLSNGRAIVWIHLEHGHLKPLRNWQLWRDHEKYNFDSWHLAFEVDLKKCSHGKLDVSDGWKHKFKESLIYKQHGDHTDRHFEHVLLDLHNAEFLHEFSSFEGLFQSHDRRPIDKVQAAVHYVKSHYLPRLVHWGLNIIYTAPVWLSGSAHLLSSCALTAIDFQVYSKTKITRHTWAHASTEPAIVIVGVTGFRKLPSTPLHYSASLIVRASRGISYGTVSVSRATFIEERLLKLLTSVNALTTVIPKFYGVHNGVWKVDLTTWAKHDWRKDQICEWQKTSGREGFTKYKWQHRDYWTYEHEESGGVAVGSYSVSCVTRNFVELPVATRKRVLDIKIWGEVDLHMAYQATSQSASAKSSARWEALIVVQNDLDGLKISVVSTPTVRFEETKFEGDAASAKFADLHTALQAQLPSVVDLSAVLKELKVFEGAWQFGYAGMQAYALANPVLTPNGDILFELRLHGQQATKTSSQRYGNVSGSVSPRGTVSRSSSSFLGRVRTAISSALQEGAVTNGHGTVHTANGHVGTNGHAHTSETYTVTRSMTVEVSETKSEAEFVDAEDDRSSFLVPAIA